ncbi:MAG: efflux RND transporter periplasmic adaptor subunit [Salibacteraceae bacterium]
MKNINKKTVIIALCTMAIGLALGWMLFGNANDSTKQEHQHETSDAASVWTCSMHPQIRQNEPGDCPICGMDLIPLASEQGEDQGPMAISMSQTAMQLAQVQSMVVGKNDALKSIRLNGKVETDERLLFTQASHIPGRIEKLEVNFTGELISEGQVIAYVYSPELVTAQEELFEARKMKENQPSLYKGAIEKLKNWKLSEQQIEQIISSETVVEQFPILANVSGHVTKKLVNLGDYIKQGQSIYEIADLSKVWVLFDVYESDINWIKGGESVEFTVQSVPGKTFNGVISYLDPVIDPKTRVAKARLEYNNSNLLLRPEMFASGTIKAKVASKDKYLTVPKTAVMWTGKRSVVYIMSNNSKGASFMMREVNLGPKLGESYVIESGLEAGEEIAINGTFSIDAAAQLAGKPSMMNPEGGVAMTGHNHGGAGNSKTSVKTQIKINVKAIKTSAEVKKALEPIFDYYFELKNALTEDDFEAAQKAAIAMKTELGKVNMNLFRGDAHNAWMEYSSSLKNHLKHVNHMSDISALRKSFILISNSMLALARTFDPLTDTIYVQHCPMADEGRGAYWLSISEKILNPYFGAEMLECGESELLQFE